MPSDIFFGSNPADRASALSDLFTNTRFNVGGNTWYGVKDDSSQDIAWTIVHENNQDIAWNILNEFNQDIAWGISTYGVTQDVAWNVYARILYFIQQFNLKAICFGYNIKEPISFNKQVVEPLEFVFYPTSAITDTAHLHGEVFDAIKISSPITYNFQLATPVQFNFGTTQVLKVVQATFPVRPICFNYKIEESTQFSRSIADPLEWTFRPTSPIIDTAHLRGGVLDTITISARPMYNFQIINPVQFTFGLTAVQHGEVPG